MLRLFARAAEPLAPFFADERTRLSEFQYETLRPFEAHEGTATRKIKNDSKDAPPAVIASRCGCPSDRGLLGRIDGSQSPAPLT